MQSEDISTPFGRRPVSLALIKRQMAVSEIAAGKSVGKWKVFRDVAQARAKLGLQDRSVAILDALLSFYPENELRHDAQMIVFPSNVQLTLRAHGIAGATLRRHLAILIDAALIVRKDSANGKRYASKDENGKVDRAFGFDLAPLLARAEELATMAQQVAAERAALRRAKENLTICRRDVRKLITAAIEEGGDGDWGAIESAYGALVDRIPSVPSRTDLADILESMQLLKDEIINRLKIEEKIQKNNTNDAQDEHHIQNSNPESLNEFESGPENGQDARPGEIVRPWDEPLKALPLGVVLKACPQIVCYASNGHIRNWRELMSAAVVVRSMLGVSPSAYEDACETMGPENAAVAMACILERANLINSPGGYLRDLSKRSERGQFALAPMIMALLRAKGRTDSGTG